jgi:hypothetical protein
MLTILFSKIDVVVETGTVVAATETVSTITVATITIVVLAAVVAIPAIGVPTADPCNILDAAAARPECDLVQAVVAGSTIGIFTAVAVDGRHPPKTARSHDTPAFTAAYSATSWPVVWALIICGARIDAYVNKRIGASRAHRTGDYQTNTQASRYH